MTDTEGASTSPLRGNRSGTRRDRGDAPYSHCHARGGSLGSSNTARTAVAGGPASVGRVAVGRSRRAVRDGDRGDRRFGGGPHPGGDQRQPPLTQADEVAIAARYAALGLNRRPRRSPKRGRQPVPKIRGFAAPRWARWSARRTSPSPPRGGAPRPSTSTPPSGAARPSSGRAWHAVSRGEPPSTSSASYRCSTTAK